MLVLSLLFWRLRRGICVPTGVAGNDLPTVQPEAVINPPPMLRRLVPCDGLCEIQLICVLLLV